jgi:hypothetical protein
MQPNPVKTHQRWKRHSLRNRGRAPRSEEHDGTLPEKSRKNRRRHHERHRPRYVLPPRPCLILISRTLRDTRTYPLPPRAPHSPRSGSLTASTPASPLPFPSSKTSPPHRTSPQPRYLLSSKHPSAPNSSHAGPTSCLPGVVYIPRARRAPPAYRVISRWRQSNPDKRTIFLVARHAPQALVRASPRRARSLVQHSFHAQPPNEQSDFNMRSQSAISRPLLLS